MCGDTPVSILTSPHNHGRLTHNNKRREREKRRISDGRDYRQMATSTTAEDSHN